MTLGHTRIAFILGNPDHAAIADRYKGFEDGMRACGLKIDKKLVVQGYNSFTSGLQAARPLLQLPEDKRPTAIFSANDEMAAGVSRRCSSNGTWRCRKIRFSRRLRRCTAREPGAAGTHDDSATDSGDVRGRGKAPARAPARRRASAPMRMSFHRH